MAKVTARAIAYACVQVSSLFVTGLIPNKTQARFMLSSCEQWMPTDGDFDAIKFYNNIVELFEADEDDPWVKETLEFWNKYVFLSHFSTASDSCLSERCQVLLVTRNAHLLNSRVTATLRRWRTYSHSARHDKHVTVPIMYACPACNVCITNRLWAASGHWR